MGQENSQMKRDFQKLMSTQEGQQLLKLLSSDGGKTLRQAGEALKSGNQTRAQETIAPMLQNPQVQQLMKALEKAMGNG